MIRNRMMGSNIGLLGAAMGVLALASAAREQPAPVADGNRVTFREASRPRKPRRYKMFNHNSGENLGIPPAEMKRIRAEANAERVERAVRSRELKATKRERMAARSLTFYHPELDTQPAWAWRAQQGIDPSFLKA